MTRWAQQRLERFIDSYSRRVSVDGVYLGTSYGGWWVPYWCLNEGSVAVCAGAGEDISFEVALARYGLQVVMVDPTPAAQTHVEAVLNTLDLDQQTAPSNSSTSYTLTDVDRSLLMFLPVGLAGNSGTMRFYVPKEQKAVSHSAVNIHNTTQYFEALCLTFSQVLERAGFRQCMILKMDIEGAEYEVISALRKASVWPSCLCVEFDEGHHRPTQWATKRRIKKALNQLHAMGYALAYRHDFDCTFIRHSRSQ